MTVTPLRTYTIGGSECAAAAGVHPYISRVQLWAEKTGRMERAETEAMAWGTALEPVIREAVIERGYDVMPGAEFTDGFAVAHTDGFTVAEAHTAVLELKAVGQWSRHHGGRAPVQYEAQCQWYMHLCGLDRALLAMLVGGQRLDLVTIDRDDRAIELLLAASEEFVGYLRRDEPPPPDASDSARDALLALYPEHQPGKLIRLDRDDMETVRELRERKAQLDTVKSQVAALQHRLMERMGDAETAISPSDYEVLRWRTSVTRRVDVTALKTQRPELAELFTTETTTRRFTVQ